jgi:DNA-binding transcriptional ArsR family regulator
MSRPIASADIFQAIADPARRAILARLREGEQKLDALGTYLTTTSFEMNTQLFI